VKSAACAPPSPALPPRNRDRQCRWWLHAHEEVPALSWRLRERRAAAPPTPPAVSLSRPRFTCPRRPPGLPRMSRAGQARHVSCSKPRRSRAFKTAHAPRQRLAQAGAGSRRQVGVPRCRAPLDFFLEHHQHPAGFSSSSRNSSHGPTVFASGFAESGWAVRPAVGGQASHIRVTRRIVWPMATSSMSAIVRSTTAEVGASLRDAGTPPI